MAQGRGRKPSYQCFCGGGTEGYKDKHCEVKDKKKERGEGRWALSEVGDALLVTCDAHNTITELKKLNWCNDYIRVKEKRKSCRWLMVSGRVLNPLEFGPMIVGCRSSPIWEHKREKMLCGLEQ